MRIDTAALRLTLGYLLLAGLWILLSDHLLTALGLSVAQQERLQSLKGLFFVTLTAALLYLVLAVLLKALFWLGGAFLFRRRRAVARAARVSRSAAAAQAGGIVQEARHG